ncbi:MAG: PHP domain-containing protein [Oscillospiraceae bacterium]|nr:PHP domain-containing protein [Oscillospiraceae bacterium]
MMKLIDLHAHTSESDGSLSPTELVKLAKAQGLAAVAVTDHDTAEGLEEAMWAAAAEGVELVPGIELSVDYRGEGVHILGYFIDPDAEALKELLAWVVWERERRNGQIAEVMAADGLPVSLEYMHERFPEAVIGRPHFSAVLVENGVVSSVAEGFEKYLSPGGRYYRRRQYIPIDMAFDAIKRSGGKAVFAHPLQYRYSHGELIELTELLVEKGLTGMECIYSVYTPEETEYLRSIAEKYGLCVTGGSDFHGSGKPHIQLGSGCGDMKVPYELLEKLKNAKIKV